MKDEDIQNLLGGFAADILTGEERELLYAAALKDQKLFNALADEQALRELLSDPVSRRRLLQALEPARPNVWDRLSGWIGRPAAWAIAGSVVAVLLVAVALRREKPPATEIARYQAPAAQSSPLSDANRAAPPAAAPAAAGPVPRVSPAAAKMKVAVMDFVAPAAANKEPDVGKTASDLLTRDLDSSGYTVIDRKQVNQALEEQKLNARELDASGAASLGRSVGADAVIVGSVQPAAEPLKKDRGPEAASERQGQQANAPAAPAAPMEVRARAINTKTAASLGFASAQSRQSQLQSESSLAGAVNQVASSLREQIRQKAESPTTGLITGVTARLLRLNLGERQGIKVGDRFDVLRDAKLIGRVVITSVQDSLSAGTFQGEGTPKVGDTVTATAP